MQAIEDYHNGNTHSVLTYKSTGTPACGCYPLRYRIEQARIAYEEIKDVDASNVDSKLNIRFVLILELFDICRILAERYVVPIPMNQRSTRPYKGVEVFQDSST